MSPQTEPSDFVGESQRAHTRPCRRGAAPRSVGGGMDLGAGALGQATLAQNSRPRLRPKLSHTVN